MTGKVLIVNKGNLFLTDALENTLHQSGIVTACVEPEISQIHHEIADSDIIVLLAGDYIFEISDVLVYLKDICTGEDKSICIIGYTNELSEIEEYIPQTAIAQEFHRPYETKRVADILEKIMANESERKKSKHILLVDDDLTFLKMMKGWLSPKYRVTAVRSGMQAITYIANHTPDLILLDYSMPVLEGSKILELIRSEQESKNIPVIFLTGRADSESVTKVMSLKPDGYLLKSMGKTQILDAIDNWFLTKKYVI